MRFDLEKEIYSKVNSMLNPSDMTEELLKTCQETFGSDFRQRIESSFLPLLKSANYPNKEMYLEHTMRVSLHYMRWIEEPSMRGVELALIHNVLEMSDITTDDIYAIMGDWGVEATTTLLLDRKRKAQDPAYLKMYYAGLENADLEVGLTKIMDKLDNILIIFRNADNDRRRAYLDEIQTFVLPLIKAKYSAFYSVFLNIYEETVKLGHISLDKYLEMHKLTSNDY